jgi:hypothetical protein
MEDSKKIIPGFMMGIVRAAISHPVNFLIYQKEYLRKVKNIHLVI